MDPVRLGIIGCGIAARELHWPALARLGDRFTVTTVCNHTEPKAQSFAELAGGVPYVTDYHALLDNPAIEAVSISLPYHLNLQVTRDALAAGKHVILEKPVAALYQDADEMLKLERDYPSLVTMVAENFRYRPIYRRVKELIDSGALGNIYHVLWNYFFFVDPDKNQYAQTPWRGDERYPGGFIVDAGVHSFALIRMLFGEFVEGRALTAGVTPALGLRDTISLQFTMDSGVDGVLNLFYSVKGLRANTIHIFGDTGTCTVEKMRLTVERENREPQIEEFDDDMGYYEEFVNFHDAIRNGAAVVSTISEACRDFHVTMRAFEGGYTRGIVNFRQ